METNAVDVLFEYLREIFYRPERANLDLDLIPADMKKLAMGLIFLCDCVSENKAFVSSLSKGDYSAVPPSVENPIAAPAKELQGALRHIAWQTGRVAQGDFKQRIDFMGEFSSGFNTMVEQLAERTDNLVRAQAITEEKNKALSQYQKLLFLLIQNTPELVMLIDDMDGTEYLHSRSVDAVQQDQPRLIQRLREELLKVPPGEFSDRELSFVLPEQEMPVVAEPDIEQEPADIYVSDRRFFNVSAYPIRWKDRLSRMFVLRDNTAEVKKEKQLVHDAMSDALTNLFNRRYAVKLLEECYNKGAVFTLSVIDVDYLKRCNDVYGHSAGDVYLQEIAGALKALPGENTVCRVGGDEFFIINLEGRSALEQDELLEALRTDVVKGKYSFETVSPMSFSYGSADNIPPGRQALTQIMKDADMNMYKYKGEFKRGLHQLDTNWELH